MPDVPASIRRENYATRKEYRWAKKVEKRRTQRKLAPMLLMVFLAAIAAGLITHSFVVYLAVIFLVGPALAIVAGVMAALKQG